MIEVIVSPFRGWRTLMHQLSFKTVARLTADSFVFHSLICRSEFVLLNKFQMQGIGCLRTIPSPESCHILSYIYIIRLSSWTAKNFYSRKMSYSFMALLIKMIFCDKLTKTSPFGNPISEYSTL